MGTDTKIEWTDATWNPVRGCAAVSPGCANCYAAGVAARFSGPGLPYEGLATRKPGQPAKWTGKIRLVPDKLTLPLQWQKPKRVFVNSMSDLFHPDVPFDFVDQVFAVMALSPQHTFQVLTKRPERMAEYLLRDVNPRRFGWSRERAITLPRSWSDWPGAIAKVWLGTSVENQLTADERIPHLLKCPATVRFLSCEPLLGPVYFLNVDSGEDMGPYERRACGLPAKYIGGFGAKIDWVIVGGESGKHARPMHPEWAQSIQQQCAAAGVPFFFKQWGEYIPISQTGNGDGPGCSDHYDSANSVVLQRNGTINFSFPEGAMTMLKIGKKAAGRILDGRTWDQFPGPVSEVAT